IVETARARGANMHLAGGSAATALRSGVEALVLRGILSRDGDAIRIAPGESNALGFYAASVLQRLSEPDLPGRTEIPDLVLPSARET
ncbi:MAG: hypothetical protein KJZ59_08060, partial [Pararhodobacter sp.]|nr:hypothetical protein [Pararhodobacter sp.]